MSEKSSSGKRSKRIKKKIRQTRELDFVQYGFMLLLFLLPMMLGTTATRPWPMFIGKIGIILLFFVFLFDFFSAQKEVKTSPFFLVMLLPVIVGIIQLVPLPPLLLGILSPEASALYHSSLDGLGLYGLGQWRSMSLDPAETWRGVSTWSVLALVFILCGACFNHYKKMKTVLTSLVVIGFIVALIGIIQKALGVTKVFGVIPMPNPESPPPFLFSTFINSNNLAAFLGICFPIQFVLAIKEKELQKKIFYYLVALVTISALFLTLSRGGIISFIAGQAILGMMLYRKNKLGKELIGMQIITAIVVMLVAIVALHEFAREIDSLDLNSTLLWGQREGFWQDSINMIKAFPLFGIGIEAYKVAYPVFKTYGLPMLFVYPENMFLQICLDFGVVIGIAFIVAFGALVLSLILRKTKSRLEIAAVSGIAIVIISNYVDFSLSLMAVSVPFVMLVSVMAMRMGGKSRSKWLVPKGISNKLLLAVSAFLIVITVTGEAYWLNNNLSASQERLHNAVYDMALSEDAYKSALNDEIDLHPVDFYLRILASERYRAGSFADFPMKYLHLDMARRLHHSHPIAYEYLAYAFAGMGEKEDAQRNCKKAVSKTLLLHVDDLWKKMLGRRLTADDLLACYPDDEAYVIELGRLLLGRNYTRQAERLLKSWTSKKDSSSPEIKALLGENYLRTKEFGGAEKLGTELITNHPKSSAGYRLLGEVEYAKGSLDTAFEWFAKAEKYNDKDLRLLYRLARISIAKKNIKKAKKYVKKIHALSWRDANRKLNAFLLSGSLEEVQGQYLKARRQYETALIYAPENPVVFRDIGRTYDLQEDFTKAEIFYKLAIESGLKDRRIQKRLLEISR